MERLVEGWTDQVRQVLKSDGVPVDLSGCSLSLVLRTNSGRLIPYQGVVVIEDAANGIVLFQPAPTDLVAANSPLSATWMVTDSGSNVSFFPAGSADTWYVRLP